MWRENWDETLPFAFATGKNAERWIYVVVSFSSSFSIFQIHCFRFSSCFSESERRKENTHWIEQRKLSWTLRNSFLSFKTQTRTEEDNSVREMWRRKVYGEKRQDSQNFPLSYGILIIMWALSCSTKERRMNNEIMVNLIITISRKGWLGLAAEGGVEETQQSENNNNRANWWRQLSRLRREKFIQLLFPCNFNCL